MLRWQTLGTKTRFIAIFPLLCQFIFASVLLWLISSIQNEVRLEDHARDVIVAANNLLRQTSETVASLGLFSSSGERADDRVIKSAALQVQSDFARLKHVSGNDRNQADSIKRLSEDVNKLVELLYWILKEQSYGLVHWGEVNKYSDQQVFLLSKAFFDETGALIAQAQSGHDQALKQSRELRSAVSGCLGIAFPLTISVAAILAFLYTKQITLPLRRMTLNTRRLAQGTPLVDAQQGDDELSSFDRLFHEVADMVLRSAKQEQELIDNAADLICTIQDGVFTSANSAVLFMLGYKSQELIGRDVISLVVPEQKLDAETWLNNLRSSGNVANFELMLEAANGRIVESRWSAFWSELTQCSFAVVTDLTERRRAERIKRDLAEMLSQDLKIPLGSMIASLETIGSKDGQSPSAKAADKLPLSAAAQGEVAVMLSGVKQLVELVDDLLDFQKLTADKIALDPSVCDLEELVTSARQAVRAAAQSKSIKFDVLCEPGLTVRCDKGKIIQTLMNLLSNAVRFSSTGDTIVVRCTDVEGKVQFVVRDSGPGVPEQFREKIFEPFEQIASLKKEKESSGLGLAICKLIVQSHGGTIGVWAPVMAEDRAAEDASQGSEFWFCLPKNLQQD